MLKSLQFIVLLLSTPLLIMAQVKGGVYTYSKGLNKAQSHAYIVPVSPDSVFIYIHSVGPAPEFNTDVVRGWLIGEGNKRY